MILVDAIEDGWATLEMERQIFRLPLRLLPAGVKEGDCLSVTVVVDEVQTAARRAQMQQQFEDLF